MPVSGLERVEVLRDGASAIYGADAVAGVVNYVLKTDFEGFSIRAKYATWEVLPRDDMTLTLEWGKDFNGGRTNVSVFANYYQRDAVNSRDDGRWANDDYRRLLPENSPWAEPYCDDRDVNGGDNSCTRFYNSSTNSEYGQYDIRTSVNPSSNRDRYGLISGDITDSSGEFQVYPIGHPECQWELNEYVCGAADGPPIYRYNNNENRNLQSELDRINVFAFINHEFGNGLQSFTEMSAYLSYTDTLREGNARLSAVAKYRIPAENYWNPFGPCGADNRLPFDLIGDDTNGGVPCAGLELEIDNYRWLQYPRYINNDGDVFRVLQGFRGELGSWDWEAAATWSRATKSDVTRNRISNTLITEMLNDPTPAAYNMFAGREANIDPALITVRRDNETELKSVDFRMSNNELFEMPAGPAGIVAGVEFRQESFVDDRDPRLDGTITFTDASGNGFPFVSDVVGSSPSLDSSGERDVTSAFAELQIPLFSTLDIQAALRYEDFSDIGDTTVGKLAFGWRQYALGGIAGSDCSYGMQRTAGGSDLLDPEQSVNTSIGIVWDVTANLTLTLDYWAIEKEDTIGLFGEENHTALDLLRLIEAGNGNCASVVGNPAVVREDASGLSQEEIDAYNLVGICPVGDVQRVDDTYANLDTRKINGHDLGVYYNKSTSIGDFSFTYLGAFLDEYEQVPTGPANELIDAIDSGVLPGGLNISGFADLKRQNGNPDEKHTVRLNWRKGDYGASLSGMRIGDFVQTALTFDDGFGPLYVIPSRTTYNASFDYRFDAFSDTQARVRFGIVNLTSDRAPLADVRFGYYSDVHTDMPRSYYVDLKLDF
jgi:outer membrane receptor protein involved in Fe transport